MLPTAHRLTDGEAYRQASRTGQRAGSRTVVVHLVLGEGSAPARIGLVVSKAVGPAVTRNRVKRRLRHLVRARLSALPGGSQLVVRALPAAAAASSTTLGGDLDGCLGRLLPGGAA